MGGVKSSALSQHTRTAEQEARDSALRALGRCGAHNMMPTSPGRKREPSVAPQTRCGAKPDIRAASGGDGARRGASAAPAAGKGRVAEESS